VHTLEGLIFKGKKHGLLVDIYQRNRVDQQEEPVAYTVN